MTRIKRRSVIIIFSVLMTITALSLQAQTEGLVFNDLSSEKAFELAKKENKVVFIDFYTEQCPPCRQMEAEVFPLITVGKYFNENFINLKIDLLSDEGKAVAAKYFGGFMPVVPAYLYLSPDGEKLLEKNGFRDASQFLKEAKEANDKYRNVK